MTIKRPFCRNYRPNIAERASNYIKDPEYAKVAEHYVRAFLIIQNDLKNIFEYVEPSDNNLKTYSYRIHELLMRTSIEVEANLKAILEENIYISSNYHLTMKDYWMVDKSHHLSSYSVIIPAWNGAKNIFRPFQQWYQSNDFESLDWYQAYNESKHDRQKNFKKANLDNLLNAVAGLLIVLSSQFEYVTFSNKDNYYTDSDIAIGDFFDVVFPTDWNEDEKYDFKWKDLSSLDNKFAKIDYNKI